MEGILETIASNDEVAIQSSFQEFNEKVQCFICVYACLCAYI